ncbi:hypothetical protein [Mastigocladopsis repens]|uniref:hypothetical protein n=1 Tax=Mastigocladopsis repens TaxID=221287 RepID=UPI00037999B7|nr:hypothetical protein [Mastigocladopsis repens]
MSFTRSGINPSIIFVSLIKFLLNKLKYSRQKTHDYTQCVCGRDYVFEPVNNWTQGYMTGQGKGIKRGDYILLQDGSNFYLYKVEEIDYYSEPPDMWIAFLQEAMTKQ